MAHIDANACLDDLGDLLMIVGQINKSPAS